MISILSLRISFEATSAALVGSLAVSTSLSLRGSFLPTSLIRIPPALLISSMASSSAQGEASPKEAIGPVEGFGWPTRMNSFFSAARADFPRGLRLPPTARAAPMVPAFLMNSLRLSFSLLDICRNLLSFIGQYDKRDTGCSLKETELSISGPFPLSIKIVRGMAGENGGEGGRAPG